jgi:hypothetical protein
VTQNVTLAQPATLGGFVRCCTSGTTTATPGPRPGWTVFLYLQSQYPGLVTASTTTVAPNGGFSFAVQAGTYVLSTGPTNDPANAIATKTVTIAPSQQDTNEVITVSQ